MAMTRAEWNALQARLPKEDRSSYEDYLTSIGAVAPATSFTPSQLAAEESGAIGAASIASQMATATAAAEQAINQAAASAPANAGTTVDTNENPPAEGLKAGYEWYRFNKPGGGFEWRQRPTRETLTNAYTNLFSGGSAGTGGTGVTSGGGGSDIAALLAQQQAAAQLAAQQAAQAAAEEKRRQGQSAYNLLFEQFNQFGLGALVQPLQDLIVQGLSAAEFTLRLRDTDAYKKRFAANQQRISKGLRALSEAEYITLEDQYQNVMRNYGLPANYYTRGDMGRQEGFERFIAGDVSAAELEDRIQTAQNRVINAAPEVARSLREFYPDISNGDILAYALDPDKALTEIRRKVTAAEIGAGAMQAGLATGVARAEELQRFGVTGEQARAGFQAISDILPRGRQLSEIYGRQGVGPFTQETAEREVFGLTGAAEAGRQRRKLTELEQAAFSGQVGAAGGALARDRAGAF